MLCRRWERRWEQQILSARAMLLPKPHGNVIIEVNTTWVGISTQNQNGLRLKFPCCGGDKSRFAIFIRIIKNVRDANKHHDLKHHSWCCVQRGRALSYLSVDLSSTKGPGMCAFWSHSTSQILYHSISMRSSWKRTAGKAVSLLSIFQCVRCPPQVYGPLCTLAWQVRDAIGTTPVLLHSK